jgi:peptidoglycan/xylan/chitin deacetylase (PgdA/CDA1 family)
MAKAAKRAKKARKAKKAVRRARRSLAAPVYAAVKRKSVWLTFDDGPHPANTRKVLTTLAAHGIKATFFVLGENAASRIALVKEAFDAGHRIGNHSYSHPNLTTLGAADVETEIVRTEAVIKAYLGDHKLFRPPYGAHNATVDGIAGGLNYRSIFWNVDTEDWKAANKPAGWIDVGINGMDGRDDCRVLNHDIHPTTADNLDAFIQRIKSLGNVTFMAPADL